MKKTYYAIAVACLLLPSCKRAGEKSVQEISYQGDTVTVATGFPVLNKISTIVLEKEPFSSEFRTVGTVQAEMEHYAEVGVPFDGRITVSKVMLGSRVRTGQTLFEVSPPRFFRNEQAVFPELAFIRDRKGAIWAKEGAPRGWHSLI